MGNLLTSRRALIACLAVACSATVARADALVKPADPSTLAAKSPAQPGTVHEDSLAAPAPAPLTPKAVAARQAQRAAAASTNPPWYSLSRLKGLLPSLKTMESWIPGLKKNPVTVRTVPRTNLPAAKTVEKALKPLAATQQARITRTAAASTIHVPQGEMIAPVPAPEPSTWMILALGGAGGWYWRSRRNRA